MTKPPTAYAHSFRYDAQGLRLTTIDDDTTPTPGQERHVLVDRSIVTALVKDSGLVSRAVVAATPPPQRERSEIVTDVSSLVAEINERYRGYHATARTVVHAAIDILSVYRRDDLRLRPYVQDGEAVRRNIKSMRPDLYPDDSEPVLAAVKALLLENDRLVRQVDEYQRQLVPMPSVEVPQVPAPIDNPPESPTAPTPDELRWHRVAEVAREVIGPHIDDHEVVRALVKGKEDAKMISEWVGTQDAARRRILTAMQIDPDKAPSTDPRFHLLDGMVDPICEAVRAWGMLREVTGAETPEAAAREYATANVRAMEEQAKVGALMEDIDGVYNERARLVAALAGLAMFLGESVGLGEHDPADTAWDPAWRTIVYVELPDGNGDVFQAGWHISDADRPLVAHLPKYLGRYDGHTTEEKYNRMAAAVNPKAWPLAGRIAESGVVGAAETVSDAWKILLSHLASQPS